VTRERVARALLFLCIAAGLFVNVGNDRAWRQSEERCAKVVAEMVRSGDWLVPRLDGAPRLQKPPLFYWAGAAAAELGGANLWTLRGVSGLAALALAAAVWQAGRALGDERTGNLCALMLAACALFFVRGRVGDAEMLLALCVFAALAVFEALWRTRQRKLLAPLALFVGLGFLTKATAALLCIFAPIVVWLALERRLDLALRPAVLGWAAVAAAIGLSWYVAIVLLVPEAAEALRAFVVAPLGHQAGSDATHLRSFLYYFPRLPVELLPASVLAPWLAWEGWRSRFWRDDASLRFWAVAFLAQLFGWSAVPSKQIHYLLPAVPVYAMLAGRSVDLLSARGRG
jgi:4-amino-4-deoxy-L-arabinose transferase-like glycosyltransferase